MGGGSTSGTSEPKIVSTSTKAPVRDSADMDTSNSTARTEEGCTVEPEAGIMATVLGPSASSHCPVSSVVAGAEPAAPGPPPAPPPVPSQPPGPNTQAGLSQPGSSASGTAARTRRGSRDEVAVRRALVRAWTVARGWESRGMGKVDD